MTKRTIHRRLIVDGTTETGVIPREYREKKLDDPYADVLTFEQAIETIDIEYDVTEWYGHYDHEANGIVFGEPGDEQNSSDPRWTQTDNKALVNPYWVENPDELPETRSDPVWSIKTSSYTSASPGDIWAPLFDVLLDEEIDVFGEIRLTRDGGAMHMDLFFADEEYHVEYGDNVHRLGISSGHDYFGSTKQYADVIALDMSDDLDAGGFHILRDLTEARERKHTGTAPSEIADWWATVVEITGEVSSTLYGVVTDAMAYTVDIGDLPCTIEEFYEALGLPNSGAVPVAEDAANRALRTVSGGYDAYHLHRAGMYALEDEYDGKDTRTFTSHVASLNELLYNPANAEKQVIESLVEEIDEEQTTISSAEESGEAGTSWAELESERDRLMSRVESISEGVDEFESSRDRLRTMLQDADDATEEAGA